MASIDRTAYPRFKRSISVRELREAYSPSLDELEWARQMTDSDEALLSLTMCLKCCQRLGYFARFDEVPASIAGHLRQELGLHESVNPATVPDGTIVNVAHHLSRGLAAWLCRKAGLIWEGIRQGESDAVGQTWPVNKLPAARPASASSAVLRAHPAALP